MIYAIVAVAAVESARALPASAMAFLFIVAASFDGFSQVVRQGLGRRRLAPLFSPAKTVEVALGGLLAAGAVAAALHGLVQAGAYAAAGRRVAMGAAALAGDLSKSWVKRRAGIKDFAATLPGQGGLLDRFDGFRVASALVGPALRWVS